MDQKQCPKCGGYYFFDGSYIKPKNGKIMLQYKYKDSKLNSIFMISTSTLILLAGICLMVNPPRLANPQWSPLIVWIAVGCGIPAVIFAFFGFIDFIGVTLPIDNDNLIPEYVLFASVFVGSALMEHYYNIGKQLLIFLGIIIFVWSVFRYRSLRKNWKSLYTCRLCGYSLAWEPGDPYPEIQDNPSLRELGLRKLEQERQQWD